MKIRIFKKKNKEAKDKTKKKGLFRYIIRTFKEIVSKIKSSLSAELLSIVGICIVLSLIIGQITTDVFNGLSGSRAYIDYSQSYKNMESVSWDFYQSLVSRIVPLNEDKNIQDFFESRRNYNDYMSIVITDSDGNVMFKDSSDTISKVDVAKIISLSVKQKNEGYVNQKSFNRIYPMTFKGKNLYLVATGNPQPTIEYYKVEHGDKGVLATGVSFIAIFLFIVKKKVRYIESISKGLIEISKGNLTYEVEIKGKDELALLAENINYMEREINSKIKKEREAENTKNELITNVSHDLRTPLTSIMGYIGLLKDKKYENEEQLKEYLNIAYNKSEKLKLLIEDLFEYTKITNRGVKLYKRNVSLNEFLEQVIEEIMPIAEENNLTINKDIIKEKIETNIDGDKMFRVFDNLITNAIKYSNKPGAIKVSLVKDIDNSALVCVENECDTIDKEDLVKIFDRFYVLEKSRSSKKGGSGLGLAICKSIVELHEGEIWADYEEGTVKFFVRLSISLTL